MGFLDKAKAMADQAMSSLDQTVSPEGENDRRGEQLFRDLGALTWAQHRGSATQATADEIQAVLEELAEVDPCLLYTSPSPRDRTRYRMPSSA